MPRASDSPAPRRSIPPVAETVTPVVETVPLPEAVRPSIPRPEGTPSVAPPPLPLVARQPSIPPPLPPMARKTPSVRPSKPPTLPPPLPPQARTVPPPIPTESDSLPQAWDPDEENDDTVMVETPTTAGGMQGAQVAQDAEDAPFKSPIAIAFRGRAAIQMAATGQKLQATGQKLQKGSRTFRYFVGYVATDFARWLVALLPRPSALIARFRVQWTRASDRSRERE